MSVVWSSFASRSLLMAILIQTTRKHIWLGLSLFCVLWFDLFHIKCAIFSTFYFVHGDVLQNMPKLHSISVCACFRVCRYNVQVQARGQPVVLFFRLHPPVLIYLLYTGSFTGLELIKLTSLASQWTLGNLSVSPALALEASATMPAFVLWVQRI